MAVRERTTAPTQSGDTQVWKRRARRREANQLDATIGRPCGPYWGKPTERNFRGDDGNVGIIRSPLRASVLPDCGGYHVSGIPTAITNSEVREIADSKFGKIQKPSPPIRPRTDQRRWLGLVLFVPMQRDARQLSLPQCAE